MIRCGGGSAGTTATNPSGSSSATASPSMSSAPDAWAQVKSSAMPVTVLTSEFGTAYQQPLSVMGWEDGISISRDGLDLYCVYVPGDMLSFTLAAKNPDEFGPYIRGPLFNMDLVTNPAGKTSWIHGDILYAHRNSVTDSFTTWEQSGVSRAVFSEGAPLALGTSGSTIEKFYFTSNDKTGTYDTDIWVINSPTTLNPSGKGEPLPGFPHTTNTEDNPHVERIDANNLVLMFDSDNYTGGLGSHDIWYSISTDNAVSWTTPANVSTINTPRQEHQPHLFKNSSNEWYLYYSASRTDVDSGKLAIFRARQKTANNWNDWDTPELVIRAGNTAGIGEPTLTSNGDLSFVVVYDNNSGSATDRYDADPWFLPKK